MGFPALFLFAPLLLAEAQAPAGAPDGLRYELTVSVRCGGALAVLNGRRVIELAPAIGDGARYDVSGLLRKGENTLEVRTLSGGFRCPPVTAAILTREGEIAAAHERVTAAYPWVVYIHVPRGAR